MRKNLINARKNKGYTQKELAQKTGISERYYQKLEAGTSTGNIETWFKLKSLLNVKTIDHLLEQED